MITIKTYESDGSDGYNAGFFGYILTNEETTETWTGGGYASESGAKEAAERLMSEVNAEEIEK